MFNSQSAKCQVSYCCYLFNFAAKDIDVVVKIEGLNDKGQFVVPTSGTAEITAVATGMSY